MKKLSLIKKTAVLALVAAMVLTIKLKIQIKTRTKTRTVITTRIIFREKRNLMILLQLRMPKEKLRFQRILKELSM